MSPEELDKARVARAFDLWHADPTCVGPHSLATIAARLARENWTPPDPISPRVMAAREWLKGNYTAGVAPTIDRGEYDRNLEVSAFLAGFAAAVKLAEPLVARFIYQTERPGLVDHVNREMITTYRQSIGDE